MRKKSKKSAQEVQDEIFRKMTANQRIKITSDFSTFILSLNKLGQNYEFPRVNRPNRQNSKRT